MTWDTSNCVSLCVSAGRSDKESENGVREREREREKERCERVEVSWQQLSNLSCMPRINCYVTEGEKIR